MWELDCEEGWAPKNWCFWTVMLEKTLESPLDCKEIQPVYSEGDQPWDFFGRNNAKAETPVLWPPHVKSWLIGKDSDDGRDWGQEKKGTTEDEMAGWHHGLDGCESEWTLGVGDGQGGPACCDSWGRKELDMTERLNGTEGCSSGLCKLCIGWDFSLFVFPLMGKAEWGGNPVCWWLGLYFCFVCCLGEASCTGCCQWLGDAGSYIQVVSFLWVLTIWYSPGLVLS